MDSIVWITGAGSGIGRSITNKFLAANLKVAVSSRSKASLKEFALNKNAVVIPLDLKVYSTIEKAYKQLSENFEVDCLINNAGVTAFKSVAETSIQDVEAIIKTNLLGAIYASRLVLPEMIKRKKGVIINNLSVASEKIFKNSAVYSASKAGLKMFARVLREEVRNYNIKIINIYPGATQTPIWEKDLLRQYGKNMMLAEDVAQYFLDAYLNESTAISEEIFLRAIAGDI